LLNVSTDFKKSVYSTIRQFNGRITFNVPNILNSALYGDDRIVRFSIVEEVSVLSDQIPSNELQLTMHNSDGIFNFLNFANMQSILASKPTIKVELGLVINNPDGSFKNEEWLPMGIFNLDSWKSDVGAQTVTLTGYDYFTMLSNTDFQPASFNTLYDLAVAVFTNAGITKYNIDNSLKTSSPKVLTDSYNSRSLLQWIGIASQSAVYQDRYGYINIKPFPTLQSSNMMTTYSTSQNALMGYTTVDKTVSEINDDMGTRHLALANMYTMPEVTLEKSIYQLSVKIYDGSQDGIQKVYTNANIGGQNGISFTIDNPLINDVKTADVVAAWYLTESNYNAIHKANWRQNPCLESTDIVLAEDGIPVNNQKGTSASRQTRIYKQEFQYEGYLGGVTESRGGI